MRHDKIVVSSQKLTTTMTPPTNESTSTMTAPMLTVQQREKEANRITNSNNHKRRVLNARLCSQVTRPQKRRVTTRRRVAVPVVPNVVDVYASLLHKVSRYPKKIEKQMAMIEESGTVRWTTESHLGMDGRNGDIRQYRLEIRLSSTSAEWTELLLVKPSSLPSAGLGLFAARSLHKNQVVALYGGNSSKAVPRNTAYTIGSFDQTFFLDAVEGMASGGRPFLGAHMANDPNHSTSTVDKDRCNCQFDPSLLLVLTRDVPCGGELLVDYHREKR
jgi:hypothetical protein